MNKEYKEKYLKYKIKYLDKSLNNKSQNTSFEGGVRTRRGNNTEFLEKTVEPIYTDVHNMWEGPDADWDPEGLIRNHGMLSNSSRLPWPNFIIAVNGVKNEKETSEKDKEKLDKLIVFNKHITQYGKKRGSLSPKAAAAKAAAKAGVDAKAAAAKAGVAKAGVDAKAAAAKAGVDAKSEPTTTTAVEAVPLKLENLKDLWEQFKKGEEDEREGLKEPIKDVYNHIIKSSEFTKEEDKNLLNNIHYYFIEEDTIDSILKLQLMTQNEIHDMKDTVKACLDRGIPPGVLTLEGKIKRLLRHDKEQPPASLREQALEEARVKAAEEAEAEAERKQKEEEEEARRRAVEAERKQKEEEETGLFVEAALGELEETLKQLDAKAQSQEVKTVETVSGILAEGKKEELIELEEELAELEAQQEAEAKRQKKRDLEELKLIIANWNEAPSLEPPSGGPRRELRDIENGTFVRFPGRFYEMNGLKIFDKLFYLFNREVMVWEGEELQVLESEFSPEDKKKILLYMVTHKSYAKYIRNKGKKEELKKLWIKGGGTPEEFDRVVTLGGVAVRATARAAKKSKPP